MGNLHTTITLPPKSGLPEDEVVNTFNFTVPGPVTDFDMPAIEDAVMAFYNDVHAPAVQSLGRQLGPQISRTTKPIFRHYDVGAVLAGGPMGSPIRMADAPRFIEASAPSNGCPGEVAVALSYAADFDADVEFGAGGSRPRSRDRGRIFIGPLYTAVLQDNGNGRVSVNSATMTAILQAGDYLRGHPTVNWAVWSRAAAAMKTVSKVWVDDAFDTQRRRGQKAVIRQTLP